MPAAAAARLVPTVSESGDVVQRGDSVASEIYQTLALVIGNVSAVPWPCTRYFGDVWHGGLIESLMVIQIEYLQIYPDYYFNAILLTFMFIEVMPVSNSKNIRIFCISCRVFIQREKKRK